MPTCVLPAPAKLNLFLEILGRRDDGFHDLESVFQTIELHDRVEVSVDHGRGITLSCDDPSLPTDQRNLAWRAAEAFLGDHSHSVFIRLDKRIPHGAGLGGGSSDAATVLRALRRLLPERRDDVKIAEIAGQLGSDVPFFLLGGTALGLGRGERLSPLPDLPRQPVTVFMPNAQVSTPAAYGALTDAERGPRSAQSAAWWAERIASAGPAGILHNRLTGPAQRLCPAVVELLEWLGKQGVPALMSGSGAACFALGHLAAPAGIRAWQTWLRPRAALDLFLND